MQDYWFRNDSTSLMGNGSHFGLPFRPACSEVIFTVPLLAPVSHRHRLAVPFAEHLLSSSWHFIFLYRKPQDIRLCTCRISEPRPLCFLMICHYSPSYFRLSSLFIGICKFILLLFCRTQNRKRHRPAYTHGADEPGRNAGTL